MTEATEAMVKINPRGNEEIIALVSEANKLLAYAKKAEVNSIEQVKRANEDLNIISGIGTKLEAKRKEYVTPLNNMVKGINGDFKSISVPVEEANQILRNKILAFNAKQRKIQAKIEEEARLKEELLQKQAELTQSTGEIFDPLPVIDTPEAMPVGTVRGATGSTQVRYTTKWAIVDEDLIPRKYMMPDTVKIGRVVRAEETEIPGVKIWKEEGLAVKPNSRSKEEYNDLEYEPTMSGF